MDQEDRGALRGGLVLVVPFDDPQPIAMVLVGPVTLLAGLPRGAEVSHRRGDRPVVVSEDDLRQLADPGELVLDEGAGPRADVALNAPHPGVRGPQERRVLRAHDRVADLAAEGARFRVFDPLVGRHSENGQVDQREHNQDERVAAVTRIVEIDDRKCLREHRAPRRRAQPAPGPEVPERHEQQSEREDPGQKKELNDAEIRAGMDADDVGDTQDEKQRSADDGKEQAGEAEAAPEEESQEPSELFAQGAFPVPARSHAGPAIEM